MPRPLWSGSISFGLVHVPVRMYSAVREHKLHFHFVHEKDSSPIGYQKVCKAEGKPVADDEVVKAFEYTKGKYVFMDDEDFQQAQVEGYKAIDAKRKGKEVHRAAEIDEGEEPIDLMEALRASVQQAKRGRARKAARGGSRASRSRATSSSRRSRGSGRAAR